MCHLINSLANIKDRFNQRFPYGMSLSGRWFLVQTARKALITTGAEDQAVNPDLELLSFSKRGRTISGH